ncbi:MAG: PEGA domain-containing protein, partial [Syntrophothermus sp.]
IILLDYGIKLSSGRVYKIEITGRKKAELIPVTIHLKPENSRLYVDNIQKAANTTFTLPMGKHEIKAEKEGYYIAVDSVDVSTTRAYFSYTLKPMEDLPVQLNSQPRGARLFIDGKDMGETDTAVYLYPGKYKVMLTKPDYLEKSEVINISESSRNLFVFNLTKDEGSLNLSIEPEDAKVLIDRKDYTGKNRINLASGKHRVQIEREGYNSINEVVTIDFGTIAEKSYKLVPRTGRLLFTVQPYEADAVLSQRGKTIYKWQGLNTFNELPEGEYDLECTSEGYAAHKQKITVTEGRSLRVDVSMNKSGETGSSESANIDKSSSGIPWYYYVGGAVLTGGTAAVLLLNKKAETKSETPIQLPPDRP